jgi:hypothetical protein
MFDLRDLLHRLVRLSITILGFFLILFCIAKFLLPAIIAAVSPLIGTVILLGVIYYALRKLLRGR